MRSTGNTCNGEREMIVETTWHGNENQQTSFVWSATTNGVALYHCGENPTYSIPWVTFSAVFRQAQELASANDGVVAAGTNQNNPTPGSVGAWVLDQQLRISNGNLTPRHLSFIGPILGRMGLVTREIQANAIHWRFV